MAWNTQLASLGQITRDTFGQPVIYHRINGKTYSITAIFDITYSQSDAGGKVPATIAYKELDIKISDIEGPPKVEDTVIIDNTVYMVKDVKTSTSGIMKAVLREKR